MVVHFWEGVEGTRLIDATFFEKVLVFLGRCIVSLPDVRQAEKHRVRLAKQVRYTMAKLTTQISSPT